MNFQYGSIKLSDGVIDPVTGIMVNGTQINDEFQLVRALASKFVPRGNRSTSINFVVERLFNTERATQRFVLEHFSLLAQQASLYITIGAVGDTEVVELADAVVDAVPISFRGTSVTIQYSIRGGLPSFGVSPPGYVEPDSSMIQRKKTPIDSGVGTITITFDTPFGSVPVCTCNIAAPEGGAAIFAWPREGSETATGFIADFSGDTPGAGYKLNWIACA
jgi:hypothetical protein